MRDTDEFQDAFHATRECVERAGFQYVEGGIVLRDGRLLSGSISRPDQEIIDLRYTQEQCSATNGLFRVVGEHGVADPTPDRARQQGQNAWVVQNAQCMERKGWEMGTPRILHGSLTFPYPLDREEAAAFDVDYVQCNIELWGSPRVGGQ
jgi:hypothetical protein